MAEQDVPIDIHASKLLDWLLTRRHCNKDYQTSLNVIREKITDAIQSMPAHPKITELLAGKQLNYFICKQIVEVLKETESDSKNIFGYYSSKRMKDWQEIIRLYEKDNVYLAETALILNRNVNFEVPSINKQANKHQSNSEEFLRKSSDMIKQSNKLKAEYQNMAEKLGIKGKDVRSEFQQLIHDLPNHLEEILQELPKLVETIKYYNEFIRFTQKKEDGNFLPILSYLIKKGNTSYFEYKTGKALEDDHSGGRKSSSNDDQIDLIEIEDTGSSSHSNGNGDFVHIDKEDCLPEEGGEIDWNIETVEEPSGESSPSDAIGEKLMNKSRKEDYSLTLLEHLHMRDNFINELHELGGFFDQRVNEMKQEESILSTNQFQGAPSIIQLTSIEKLSSLLKQIQRILDLITNEKISLIFMMREDSSYVDRAVAKMEVKLEQADKCIQKSKLFEEKSKEEAKLVEKLLPDIPIYIKRTKELQNLIESEISKKYKNRPVNIMGGWQVL
ncbi:CDK5 regulatory subunit-associated protein 3 isoform X2 [Brevipalpus obovatus]|uniref:CDK5 regulatory subunit-associated protein 3 isoform X2 n=1 Tax=Brevipalpus obovatus TaxID=246614 RepID=UPI003D9FAE20